MLDVDAIAQAAEVIIAGFAVLRCANGLKVVNLNAGEGTAVFMPDGTLVETDMDQVELAVARRTMGEALAYMGA